MEEFLEMRNGRKKMATYVISDIHGEYENSWNCSKKSNWKKMTRCMYWGCSGSWEASDQNGIKTDGNAKRHLPRRKP